MHTRHAAVWIDHHEAKIFHPDSAELEVGTIRAPHHHVRRHPTVTAEHAHPDDSARFFREVAEALAGAEEILVVGPATAKLEFIKYVAKHQHALEPKIVAVETVDHPTDGQLVAYARKYFRTPDPLR